MNKSLLSKRRPIVYKAGVSFVPLRNKTVCHLRKNNTDHYEYFKVSLKVEFKNRKRELWCDINEQPYIVIKLFLSYSNGSVGESQVPFSNSAL